MLVMECECARSAGAHSGGCVVDRDGLEVVDVSHWEVRCE
jgi:hypothetical protein